MTPASSTRDSFNSNSFLKSSNSLFELMMMMRARERDFGSAAAELGRSMMTNYRATPLFHLGKP